ncbi:MAG: T9SS type A sorting domain-containing protein [Bacteroidales bacterium]
MKTITLIFLGIYIYASGFGQGYIPTVGNDKNWNVLCVVSCVPFDSTYSTISYNMSGDTVFSTGTYQKIFSSQGALPGRNLYCFMREDASHKVWMKRSSAEPDQLMYDYSVQPGDSIVAGISQVYMYVDSVTQVTINGTSRQKFWLSCKVVPGYKETWTEGVGSSRGIIYSGSAVVVGGWYWFLCLSEPGQLTYMNPDFNSCDLISGVPEQKSSAIFVYPNPAHARLKFELPGTIFLQSIHLTDISGLFSREYSPGSSSIDLSGLPSGIYLLKLAWASGETTRKIIVY